MGDRIFLRCVWSSTEWVLGVDVVFGGAQGVRRRAVPTAILCVCWTLVHSDCDAAGIAAKKRRGLRRLQDRRVRGRILGVRVEPEWRVRALRHLAQSLRTHA